jgi:outer membrane scaffolding protein for murein synthesis (MipA/OmpV family)
VVYSTEFKFERPFQTSEFMLKLKPEWASEDYMDFFYGIAPAYATPGRPSYEADSGYLGTRLSLTLKHAITKKFDIIGGLRFGFYKGAANADSPLFTQQTTSGVMLALVWKFWASERRAAARDDQAIF